MELTFIRDEILTSANILLKKSLKTYKNNVNPISLSILQFFFSAYAQLGAAQSRTAIWPEAQILSAFLVQVWKPELGTLNLSLF